MSDLPGFRATDQLELRKGVGREGRFPVSPAFVSHMSPRQTNHNHRPDQLWKHRTGNPEHLVLYFLWRLCVCVCVCVSACVHVCFLSLCCLAGRGCRQGWKPQALWWQGSQTLAPQCLWCLIPPRQWPRIWPNLTGHPPTPSVKPPRTSRKGFFFFFSVWIWVV